MIKIDKGIPRPDPTDLTPKYPFRLMEVGDSFFVEDRKPGELSGSYTYWKNKTGFSFSGRSENGGTRVWRVK